MFVGVSGLIGVGKSTLTRSLAHELSRRSILEAKRANRPINPDPEKEARVQKAFEGLADFEAAGSAAGGHTPWKPVFEPVKTNPFLADFYDDIARWTFTMQMFLLAKRFQQHQEVLWDPRHREGGGIVQDRTIYEDTIFARMHRDDGLMPDREWETYIDHFHIMQGFLRYPDVIVYLRVDPKVAAARIGERNRDAERGLPLAYLERLHEGYEEFVEEMKRYTVVLTFDWTEYQPVEVVADAVQAATAREQKFLRSLRRI